MHPAQRDFVERVKLLFPAKFLGVDVLDVGSLDINGNNRYHFALKSYIGLDVGPGLNVDRIVKGEDPLPFESESFDVVISTECMEHNAHFRKTIVQMVRVLRPGGLMIMSMAGYLRPIHGTAMIDPVASPYTHDYYKNIYLQDLSHLISWEEVFFPYCFEYSGAYDLYFYGVKKLQ